MLRRCAQTAVGIVILVVVLVVGGYFVLSAGLLKHLVLPALAARLGSDVEAERMGLSLNGDVFIDDLVLTVPDLEPEAGRLLEVERASFSLDWGMLLGGRVSIHSAVFRRPTLHLAIDQELSLNLLALSPRVSTDTSGLPASLPNVQIREGRIEVASHGEGGYERLFELDVRGSVSRDPTDASSAELVLEQVLPDRVVKVAGSVDLEDQTLDIRASDIDLNAYSMLTLPETVAPLWEALALRGQIPSVSVGYDPQDRLTVGLELDDVAMNIPVPIESGDAPSSADIDPSVGGVRPLAIDRVTGTLSADEFGLALDISGRLEDLPVEMSINYDGWTQTAPFVCIVKVNDFRLTQDPKLLPFAPSTVEKILDRFRGPTATLDAVALITGEAPERSGEPRRFSTSGRVTFRNGVASYSDFSYPFSDITGIIDFTQQRVDIRSVIGVGPNDSVLAASGFVEPLGSGSEVYVDVNVAGVRTDEVFIASLPEDRREAVDFLFSRDRYAKLIGDLEERTENGDGEARMLIERIEETGFEPGGTASVRVQVRRPLGLESHYSAEIDFIAPQAGIVPSAFPYPAIADRLHLRILPANDVDPEQSTTRVVIEPTMLHGLTGMTGSLEGTLQLGLAEGDLPDIRITANRVPVDRLLLLALPASDDAEELSPRSVVEQLELAGEVFTVTTIRRPASAETDLPVGFEADVWFRDVRASPGRLRASSLSGRLDITERSFRVVDLRGEIEGASLRGGVEASFDLREEMLIDPLFDIVFTLEGLAIEKPIEDLVEVFEPNSARAISALRESYRPSGTLDARFAAHFEDDEAEYDLVLEGLDEVGLSALDGRFDLAGITGSVGVSEDRIEVRDLASAARFNGAPLGRVAASGWLIAPQAEAFELDVRVEGARFEHPAVSALLAELDGVSAEPEGPEPASYPGGAVRGAGASGAGAAWFAEAEPVGVFDAALMVRKPADSDPTLKGRIEPRSLELNWQGARVGFTQVSGAIEVAHDGSGRFEAFRLAGDGMDVMLEGDWGERDEAGLTFDLGLTAHAEDVSDAVLSVLPAEVATIARDLTLAVEGGANLREANLLYSPDAPAGTPRLIFEGEVDYTGASLVAPQPITEADGKLSIISRAISSGGDPADDLLIYRLIAEVDSGRYTEFAFSDALVQINEGSEPGQTVLPLIRATVYDGVVSARARLETPESDPDADGADEASGGTYFELHAEVARVHLGSMLDDLGLIEEGRSRERGRVAAQFSISGIAEDYQSQRGRGMLRIDDGDILDAPGIIPLLTLSNLQIPTGEVPDFAFAEFYIDGGTLTAPTITVTSAAEDQQNWSGNFWIEGSGSATWPDLDLDLSFVTRGRRHIPLVSDVLQGLRDELVTTHVTGPINEPEVSYQQLTSTRAFLSGVIGGEAESRPIPTASPVPPGVSASPVESVGQ